MERIDNLIIIGPPGIRKSHIAMALSHEACRRKMDVLFRKTSKLIEELKDKFNLKKASRLLKRILNCKVLIIDDFAFRKYTQEKSELLYTIADERLGRHTTILTSNRPPEDWFHVFTDPVIGQAFL